MSRLFAITKTMNEIVPEFGVDLPSAVDVPMETIEGTQGHTSASINENGSLRSVFAGIKASLSRGGSVSGRDPYQIERVSLW